MGNIQLQTKSIAGRQASHDNLGQSGTAGDATVYLTVTSATESNPPHSDAGSDQTVDVGDAVALDAVLSGDIDGDAVSASWSLVSVPPSSTAALFAMEKELQEMGKDC